MCIQPRQIAVIQLYYIDFSRYPDTFADLILYIAEVFVCPYSNDTLTKGPTTQNIATNMAKLPDIVDTLYVGKGLSA